MANYKDLKPGMEVWIKQPAHIYAKLIGPRPGDRELPPEQQSWRVEILPTTQYLPPEYFELVDPPPDPNAPLKYMSKEWVAELGNFNESASRFLANNNDKTALQSSLESMKKLGWIVPKDKK